MPILKDGFPTTFSLNTIESTLFLLIKEKSLTPPGLSIGGPIDTANMRNTFMRTRWPKSLLTLKPMKVTASGSGHSTYEELLGEMGVNALIAITFANGHGLRFWGYIDDAELNEHKEGEQPTWALTLEATNEDDNGNEVVPIPF